jgi:hypothetical protein
MFCGEGLIIETAAEQRLKWFEGIGRPLTDNESIELQRALHAVYERNRRKSLAS